MSRRCQNCGAVVEDAREATQHVGDADVTLDTCGHCTSARLVEDAARTGAVVSYPTEAAR